MMAKMLVVVVVVLVSSRRLCVSAEGLFLRDVVGALYGPYSAEADGATLIAAQEAGAEVVSLSAAPLRAVDACVAPEGQWFLQCPDGVIRGPYGTEALRAWIETRQLPPEARVYAGRRYEPPSLAEEEEEEEEEPLVPGEKKKSWTRHLRPHRWRATRATMKLGKKAAKSSVQAVASVAIKSWEDEEKEWTDMISASHSSSRATNIAPQQQQQPRPQQQQHRRPPGARQSAPSSSRQQQQPGTRGSSRTYGSSRYEDVARQRAVDASHPQRADVWHEDDGRRRQKALTKLLRKAMFAAAAFFIITAAITLTLQRFLDAEAIDTIGQLIAKAWHLLLAALSALRRAYADLATRAEPTLKALRHRMTPLGTTFLGGPRPNAPDAQDNENSVILPHAQPPHTTPSADDHADTTNADQQLPQEDALPPTPPSRPPPAPPTTTHQGEETTATSFTHAAAAPIDDIIAEQQ